MIVTVYSHVKVRDQRLTDSSMYMGGVCWKSATLLINPLCQYFLLDWSVSSDRSGPVFCFRYFWWQCTRGGESAWYVVSHLTPLFSVGALLWVLKSKASSAQPLRRTHLFSPCQRMTDWLCGVEEVIRSLRILFSPSFWSHTLNCVTLSKSCRGLSFLL